MDSIGGTELKYFDQLMPVVALSSAGDKLTFVYGMPGKQPTVTTIEPRKMPTTTSR